MASLYTLADLQDAVYSRGLEDNTVMFTSTEVTDAINEALQVSNLFCGWYQGTSTMLSEAGKLVYDTPTGMIYPQRVQFNSVQLDPIPISRIGQDYRTWAVDTTARTGSPVARWVPIGINYFCLHPADSDGGQAIFVTGIMEPPVLVNATDTVSLEDDWVTILVEYASSRVPLKIGGNTFNAASRLYQAGFIPAMKARSAWQKMIFPKYFVQASVPAEEGQDQ